MTRGLTPTFLQCDYFDLCVFVYKFRVNCERDKTPYTEDHLSYLSAVQPIIAGIWSELDSDGVRIFHTPSLFDDSFTLEVDGFCWMTTLPVDLLDHRSILEEAHGSVLLTGLGLGLGVVLASANPNVEEVTVIEADRRIVTSVLPLLLPKLRLTPTVIMADADMYNPALNKYDFVYIDHASLRPPQEVIERYRRNANTVKVWMDERLELEEILINR